MDKEQAAKIFPTPFKERLMQLQTELKAPKGQYNKFAGFNYRSNEDILEALKPKLPVYQMIFDQTDGIEKIGERYYVKAVSTLSDIYSAEYKTATGYAREPLSHKGFDESQITGSSSSYARKVSASGLLALDCTKDADCTNTNTKTAPGKNLAPTNAISDVFKKKVLEDTKNYFCNEQWVEKYKELKLKPAFQMDHEKYFLEQWKKFTHSENQIKEMEGKQ